MSAQEVTNLTVIEPNSLTLQPVISVKGAIESLKVLQDFVSNYLQESEDGGEDGGDYGIIPGTRKKTLFKSGAEKLCDVYGLKDKYVFISKIENWETGLFDYVIECQLLLKRNDAYVGAGMGSCSSFESKYRWRSAERTCPQCGASGGVLIKEKDFKNTGKEMGWLCWPKKGGCGSKFAPKDPAIIDQVLGRVVNPDLADTKNTVLKIAKKRAKVDAVIAVTRSSGLFVQDVEDMPPAGGAPVKPGKPVDVTQEDTEIGGASGDGPSGEEGGGLTQKGSPSSSADTIDENTSKNFYEEFRKALQSKLRHSSEGFANDWLKVNKYVDANGVPDAKMILKKDYFDVRGKALEYAKTL